MTLEEYMQQLDAVGKDDSGRIGSAGRDIWSDAFAEFSKTDEQGRPLYGTEAYNPNQAANGGVVTINGRQYSRTGRQLSADELAQYGADENAQMYHPQYGNLVDTKIAGKIAGKMNGGNFFENFLDAGYGPLLAAGIGAAGIASAGAAAGGAGAGAGGGFGGGAGGLATGAEFALPGAAGGIPSALSGTAGLTGAGALSAETIAGLQALGYTPAQIAAAGGAGGFGGGALGAGLAGGFGGGATGSTVAAGGGSSGSIGGNLLDYLTKPQTLVGLGTQIGSALLGQNATNKAADAQTQATTAALAQQQAMYDQTRADQAPWRNAGAGAIGQLSSMTQPGGSLLKRFSKEDLTADPVYNSGLEFGLNEGIKGVNQRAMQGGGYDSGATLKALTKYANDYGTTKANESYNRYNTDQTNIYNRLAGVSGIGQAANNQVQSAGTNLVNNQTALTTDAGNARAAGIVGGANAWSNALSGIGSMANNYDTTQLLNKLLGRSGTYGAY